MRSKTDKAVEFLGWLGSVFLAVCSIPLVIDSILKGYNELPWLMLWLWQLGEIFVFVYVIYHKRIPLTLNYGLNIIGISILMYYRS